MLLRLLYQPMYSVIARRAPVLVGQGCRSISSRLMGPKKLSARALFAGLRPQARAGRPAPGTRRRAVAAAAYSNGRGNGTLRDRFSRGSQLGTENREPMLRHASHNRR
jgi:hypothetical protein